MMYILTSSAVSLTHCNYLDIFLTASKNKTLHGKKKMTSLIRQVRNNCLNQSKNYLSEKVPLLEAMLIISNIPTFSELDLLNNNFTSVNHQTD